MRYHYCSDSRRLTSLVAEGPKLTSEPLCLADSVVYLVLELENRGFYLSERKRKNKNDRAIWTTVQRC